MFPGNNYPLWIIDEKGRVNYVDSEGVPTPVSGENYASGLAISDDGVIWALTTTPDPDGGGAEISWLDDTKSWNTIPTSDPGAFALTGGPGDQCIYRTSEGVIYKMDTQGNGNVIYKDNPVLAVDYGGGNVWGVLSDQPGEIPQLHYAKLSDSLQWNEFKGVQSPTSISANYNGDCVGIQEFDPYLYQLPDSTSLFGSGVNSEALQISFKNDVYLMVAEPTINGNPIYKWVDAKGGVWMETNVKANFVLSTWYEDKKTKI